MKKELLKISIRNQAIYVSTAYKIKEVETLNELTLATVANARKLGYSFSEKLLRTLNSVHPSIQLEVIETLKEVMGYEKNWTPLVKGWNVPTGESVFDHIVTFFANKLGIEKGTKMPCGHLIPDHTFPLERYNGCPFCGTPFEFGQLENIGQGSKLKVLTLWTDEDLKQYFSDLLSSKTALDATQVESLKTCLTYLNLPTDVEVKMKETVMLVIDSLVEKEQAEKASSFFKTPNDILRYLWYKHTGFLQIVEPKTIMRRKAANSRHFYHPSDSSKEAKTFSTNDLKLKYTRTECRRVAQWLNALTLDAEKACELMHPKRGMWIRMIRALRLAEYSKKKGFEKIAKLLDVFYKQEYTVWQGRVNHFRLKYDADQTFALLKQRPGLFARSLFSNMLWFGTDNTLAHFNEIVDEVPARLVLSLNMYAPYYFDKTIGRTVNPLGGTTKRIAANKYVQHLDEDTLKGIQQKVEDLCVNMIVKRFKNTETESKTIFIAENLFNIPLPIGDRSETVQDIPSALMGTRFPLEGSSVRLFMQWGKGLPAQHLDMDLSCKVAYEDKVDFCSYSKLITVGCKHSGDIINIPEKIGTAEYININVDTLAKKGAKYVSFTCNAYSNGSISPNLVVGWMDSKYPMKVSKRTGVAYDPSCVQHQVRVTQGLAKGLVFGVLDVAKREIVWLEMSFGGQVVGNLDAKCVETLLAKLDSKLTIGNLLALKAEAQGLAIVKDEAKADEAYNMKWAANTAAVTQLLID